jgi:hypothetical protein
MGVLWVGGVEVAMRSQLLKDYDAYTYLGTYLP